MSLKNFEKRFGQSPVFVASTLLENGGVPHSASPGALLKEAIHVISCGYEDKTEWGKEVMNEWSPFADWPTLRLSFWCPFMSWKVLLCNLKVQFRQSAKRYLPMRLIWNNADWMDLWVSHRRYSDRIQDALPRVAFNLLHATQACIQGIGTHQSVWSVESSVALGTWISGN